MTPKPPSMPFLAHLQDLRKCFLHSFVAILVGFGVAYTFRQEVFALLTLPFNDAYRAAFDQEPHMITTGLVESFLVYLKVSLLAGFFLASPVVFYQVWKFVGPALTRGERKHALPVVFLATVFFVGGALFGYFGVFPLGFRFFLEVAPGDYVEPMIRMQEYFHLSSWMLVVFGLVFELPLMVLYLTITGVISPAGLIRPWRAVIIGIAVGSAILTPADPASMLLMALPLLVLYGVTVAIAFILGQRRRK